MEIASYFLQAMEGTKVELEFTNLDNFRNILVNKAELIVSIDSLLPGDDLDQWPPIDQLLLNEVTEDGESVLIEDVLFRPRLADLQGFFGGFSRDDNTYRMNISTHFQRMVDEESSSTLELIPYSRGNKASRLVLKGVGRTEGAVRMEVFYTKLEE